MPTISFPAGEKADGATVTLTCTANASPAPTSYKFFFNDALLTTHSTSTYDVTATAGNGGKPYSCIAINTEGESVQSPGKSLVISKFLICLTIL